MDNFEEELAPQVPVQPEPSFTEKMQAAKAAKKFGPDATATLNKPPAYGTQPKPATKRPLKPADQFIFRLSRKIHPALDKINVDFVKIPHTYLATSSTINWAYRVDQNGVRHPLPLTDNTEDMYDEYGELKPDIQFFPRTVRYLFSANSPFVDEQEKQFGSTLDKNDEGFNEILANHQNRDAVTITGTELRVPAYESVLISFLRITGQCGNMHPKARRRNQSPVYEMLDFGQLDKDKVDKGKKRRAMYMIASDAKLEEMIPHAKHLGIPFTIESTGQQRDLDAIREDYKDAALANPEEFERTFRDPKIKIMHQIITLKETGRLVISAGRAKWAHSNAVITLIPPNANPIDFLAGFSLDNKDFAEQLEASKIDL